MTPNETSRFFLPVVVLDVVGFPSCICQRGSASPLFGEVPEHIVMSDDTSLDLTGLDPFDGILAPSSVEDPPPGRGSR
jgi:hypothetical protein